MLTLGPLGFLAPWLLTGLIALPAIWLILRVMPPSPKLVRFAGTRLLSGLKDAHPVARHTPPCTVRQGSPSVHATAPRAYRQAASCQLIQSSTRPCASSESTLTAGACSRGGGAATGAEAPVQTRPACAVSVSIGKTAYTRMTTVWVRPAAVSAARRPGRVRD